MIEKQEGVKFAGFWTRMLAFNADLLLLLLLFYSLSFFIAENRFLYISCFLTWFFYDWLFSSSNWKGTPGKLLVKIELSVNSNNTLSVQRAFLRTLSKILSFSVLMIGFTMIAFHPKNRALHDVLAGTYVKHKISP